MSVVKEMAKNRKLCSMERLPCLKARCVQFWCTQSQNFREIVGLLQSLQLAEFSTYSQEISTFRHVQDSVPDGL